MKNMRMSRFSMRVPLIGRFLREARYALRFICLQQPVSYNIAQRDAKYDDLHDIKAPFHCFVM